MPDKIYLPPDQANSAVIKIGGDCFARQGDSNNAPTVSGGTDGFEDCKECEEFCPPECRAIFDDGEFCECITGSNPLSMSGLITESDGSVYAWNPSSDLNKHNWSSWSLNDQVMYGTNSAGRPAVRRDGSYSVHRICDENRWRIHFHWSTGLGGDRYISGYGDLSGGPIVIDYPPTYSGTITLGSGECDDTGGLP